MFYSCLKESSRTLDMRGPRYAGSEASVLWSMALFEDIYRRIVLGIAAAGPVQRLLKRNGWRLGVKRFVAGETLTEAIEVLQRLDQAGHRSILDLLGEFVESREAVGDIVNQVLITLDRLGTVDVQRQMSVKPTQLGLGISPELALGNAVAIASRAQQLGVHLCLDMENHPYTDGTLELLAALHERGFSDVSTVLQSYLHRSPADLAELVRRFPGSQVRIVKGAYREPAAVAHQDSRKVHSEYLAMLQTALDGGLYVNIATHDEQLIQDAAALLLQAGAGRNRYEFQLLYGIKPRLQARLLEEGHTVRIYVPYGNDWYGYYSRRLAERPANLGMVIRGLFG